jgi:phosphoglycolate phosphatase-like HAD superfamily hydrolase
MKNDDPAKALKEFKPSYDFFVGVDSDGCVFDTMGIKQRECFCPPMIGHFGLQAVAQAARECKDFADLFSKTRGGNRHITLKRILAELLPCHPLVKERAFEVPQLLHYFNWIEDENTLLSDAGLIQAIEECTDDDIQRELELALSWSYKVNDYVRDIVRDIPPFPFVRESLEKMSQVADVIVVSATPYEALEREWIEHDIAQYVQIIAGQEMGKKAEHLDYTTSGNYEPDHVLMIGDAPGDLKAAKANNALFYPINPGNEVTSWERFYDEAFDKFINGQYAGDYEEKVIDEFQEYLPENPPWL